MAYHWKDGRLRRQLPVDPSMEEILMLHAEHQVIVVQAETGAGKTTRISQALLLANPGERVYMTQTRRAAVRWNGRRIADELGTRVGGLVGWRLVNDQPFMSDQTRLELMVDQTMTNRVRRAGGRLPQGILIVDEAHERPVSTDLLLGFIKEGIGSSNTKVIITSATIDTQKFSAYFNGAPVISIEGRVFPVSTEVVRLGKFEHHTQGASSAAEMVLERFLAGKLVSPTEDGTGTEPIRHGSVAVLLPGKEDIREVMSSITGATQKLGATERIEVLSCHGESTPEEQDMIQSPVAEGKLRFVVATEVIRSSVTINDLRGMIDSLQVKRLVVNAAGVAHLDKIAVSRAEADQAKGRVGRTSPGFYIPVSFEREYESLAPYPTPAILQEPTTNVALQIADAGRNIRTFDLLDRPSGDKIEVAMSRLRRIDALDENELITDIGRLLVGFPIDPERAKVLVTADHLGVLPEAVVTTAILEQEGIFHLPRRDANIAVSLDTATHILTHVRKSERGDEWRLADKPRDPSEVDINDLPKWMTLAGGTFSVDFGKAPFEAREIAKRTLQAFAGESRSDFVASVRAYRAFKAEEYRLRDASRNGENGRSGREREQALRQWCFENCINFKQVRMAEDAMHQIREEVESSPLRLENGLAQNREFDATALTKALASGLVDNVARPNDKGRYEGPLGTFELGRESACTSPNLVLVGGVRKIPITTRRGGTAFLYLADTAAPLEAEWLIEVMPQLCTSVRQGDHRYHPETDEVVETQVWNFGEVEIGRKPIRSADETAAAKMFAAWLAEQELALVSPESKIRQKQARELNIRAGDDTFHVYTRTELSAWISDKGNSPRAIADIKNPEELTLPPLDAESKDRIIDDNPDTVMLLGNAVNVVYDKDRQPRTERWDFARDDHTWMQLPDEGVFLPGGRRVAINLAIDNREVMWSEIDVIKVKAMMREHLNLNQWHHPGEVTKPLLVVPDPMDEDAVFPEMTVFQYGTCVVTGEPVFGYGYVCFYEGGYYSHPSFSATHTWDREKALAAHLASCEGFAKLQAREAESRAKQAAEASLNAAKEPLETLSTIHEDVWEKLPQDLRQRVSTRRQATTPGTSAECRAWVAETEALIAEVEATIVAVREAESTRQRLIEAGELWPDVTIRKGGSHNHRAEERIWAVAGDGTLFPELPSSNWQTALFGDLPTTTLIVGWGHSNYGYQHTEWWEIHRRPGQKENRWETMPADYLPVTEAQVAVLARLLTENAEYFSAGQQRGWDTRTWKRVSVQTANGKAIGEGEAFSSFPLNLAEWQVEVEEEEWKRVHTVYPRPPRTEPRRDEAEIALVREAVKRDMGGNAPTADIAITARDLAEATRLVGISNPQAAIRSEYHSRYPWQRRREQLLAKLRGVERFEVYDRVMQIAYASDLDAVIVGAVAWLESHRLSVVSPTRKVATSKPEVANKPVAEEVNGEPSEKTGLVFPYLGKRNFRCPDCGRADRLYKDEAKGVESGGAVALDCPGCGKHGVVKK